MLSWRASYGLLKATGSSHDFVVVKDGRRYICLFQPTGSRHGMLEVPGPYTLTKREAQSAAERFEQQIVRIQSP